MVHKCKLCDYVSNLRRKSWKRNPRYIDKYRDIISKYEKIVFIIPQKTSEEGAKALKHLESPEYIKVFAIKDGEYTAHCGVWYDKIIRSWHMG